MAHVGNYLFIQKQRFSSRISARVDVEPGLEDCLIPKLTLRPIVENAFIHGLDKKRGAWEIRITAGRSPEGIYIEVRDNGIGMDRGQLRHIRERIQLLPEPPRVSGESIGLTNVAARIRLHFGEPYGLTVSGGPEDGTAVTVHLPWKGQ
ncbi:hypothetical protein LJK87_21915 [Paenibacillus sp. P25]|nr:hypothetical protein LJK87_21915 [Paenibacillus sp. P25]